MSASDKLKIYKDKRGEYRWRCTAANGNIVGASSESYSSKKASQKNAGATNALAELLICRRFRPWAAVR